MLNRLGNSQIRGAMAGLWVCLLLKGFTPPSFTWLFIFIFRWYHICKFCGILIFILMIWGAELRWANLNLRIVLIRVPSGIVVSLCFFNVSKCALLCGTVRGCILLHILFRHSNILFGLHIWYLTVGFSLKAILTLDRSIKSF